MTLPDTSCASSVGVGPSDIPHAYYTANGIVTFTNDACPDHYSGELGFGVGGVWLFSRAGPDANGDGSGVVACYGSTDPTAGPTTGHHGPHATIAVRDDFLGGAIAFTVTRDYNRSADNPTVAGTGNSAGDLDCGDSLVEPCDPADPTQYTTPPGCNPMDDSRFVFPRTGVCEGLSPLGDLFNPPTDPVALVTIVVDFVVSLLGIPTDDATCKAPPENKWTVPDGLTLGDYAGADGAVVVFLSSNVRFDAGHFGTGTSGKVWTQSIMVPVGGGCALGPGTDGYAFTCTYVGKDCIWHYRSNNHVPQPPLSDDKVLSKHCP